MVEERDLRSGYASVKQVLEVGSGSNSVATMSPSVFDDVQARKSEAHELGGVMVMVQTRYSLPP